MFDYIIVGGGSAGCVLAHRLTEDSTLRVLLIEAGGPDKQREIHIPAAFSKIFHSPADWAYLTDPQPELNNRQLYWPRGKVLGGSSAINAMIYSRANRVDHDHWHQLGLNGWGYTNMLSWYKKSEHQERGASEFHGVGGPLNVADLRTVNPLTEAFVEAGVEVGMTRSSDFNGASQEGVGVFQVTQKNGKRCSAATGYLTPILKRPNLTVWTNCLVKRVLFEGTQAIGVEFLRQGKTEQVRANREILLCGGSINSPQTLMISGVGPANHLREFNIPVVLDLPGVGQNLQDHLLLAVTYECKKPISLAGAESIGNVLQYLLFHKGMLSSNIAEGGGFLKTRSGLPGPDFEYMFGPTFYMNHGFSNPKGHGFSFAIVHQRPLSRGKLSLRSASPETAPSLQPNYLSDPADQQFFVEAVKIARHLAQAKAFDPFRGKEVWPGADRTRDTAVLEFARSALETCYHPIGTCKAGTDSMAVVDPTFRVRGIENLRVIDASVIPTIFSGHPNAVVIALAEMAASYLRSAN